jgi:hypothetical protein
MAGQMVQYLLLRGLPEIAGELLRPSNSLHIIQLTRFTYKAFPILFGFIRVTLNLPLVTINNFRSPEDPSLDSHTTIPVIA